ncbi:MAG: isoprenylcysteine carboxylmethyltransferase family protein [Steroidobacteraceae bacterium]
MHTASWLGIIFFGSELALALFKRAKSGGGDEMDRGSLKLLWLVITTSIFLAFACEFWLPQVRWPWQPWLNVMGIAIVMGGLALRWYSISYLGRFFTVNVAIAADHRLIDSGPYRWLRHPSYSGALLAFLGLGLCMRNWRRSQFC